MRERQLTAEEKSNAAKVHTILERIRDGEISITGQERDYCIFWLGGACVDNSQGNRVLLDFVVSRKLTLQEARTEKPLQWIGAITFFQALDNVAETAESALERWRGLNAMEQEVLLESYAREASKSGGPLNPRRQPFPRDLERLKKGAAALAMSEPTTVGEMHDQLLDLHLAICAMQSLDDLGTDVANVKACRDMDALMAKHECLKQKLRETT